MFLIDVTGVEPLPHRQLALTFADGFQGVVSVDQIVQSYNGIFAPLQDDAFFRRVTVNDELGTVVWPNGADLCPDVLYSYATGQPIVVNGERVLN